MNLKRYNQIRIAIVIILAIAVSQSLVLENYFLPPVLTALALLAHMYLRGKVKEVIADERDRHIGGESAMLTVQVFSWAGVVAMFILYALSGKNPDYKLAAQVLAFLVFGLLLTYSIIFRIKRHR